MIRAPILRFALLSAWLAGGPVSGPAQPAETAASPVMLPAPVTGTVALDAALRARRTTRSLAGPALSLAEASQLLWSAQGENRPGRRTVPSAHASYPLAVYLLTEGSATLPMGTYRYRPREHTLRKVGERGVSALLGPIRAMQPWIVKAPAVFVVTGTPLRISSRDPAPKLDYTFWEAGAASQALLLQAAALDLGAGVASGVDLVSVGTSLGLAKEEAVLVLLPVGRLKAGK